MGRYEKQKVPRGMKCLIVAAGQGTRLRSLAASKPLADINGTPLIEHVIRLAVAGGASEFVIVTGYEAERVENFLAGLASRSGLAIDVVRNPQWARPNGVSVLAAAPLLDGEFVLLMSDHLFEPAILSGLLAARRTEAALTLACDWRIDRPDLDLDDATKVRLGEGKRIARIGKEIGAYEAVDTGVFATGPALFTALEQSLAAGGAGSLSEGVQRLADAGKAFAHDMGSGWWVDVDDEPAFQRAERELPAQLDRLS
jgi:choline kinase